MIEPVIRDVIDADLAAVVALNEANVHYLSDMTFDAAHVFSRTASYFRVAERRNDIVGFAIVLAPEAAYSSPNFLWFQSRYERFLYVDRVVIRHDARCQGIGSMFYDDIERLALLRGVRLLACEVDVRPANPASLAFHAKRAFREVGTQEIDGGKKTVSLKLKLLERPNNPEAGVSL